MGEILSVFPPPTFRINPYFSQRMNKHFTLFILFLTALNIQAQEPLTFTEVVIVDSITSKEELYERARMWFATTFKDSKEVLRVSDKESGEIMGEGAIPFSSSYFVGSSATKGNITFEIKFYTKKGRYKYELTNFNHKGTGGYSSGYGYPPLSFGVITTDILCPPDRLPDNGNKWRNNLWQELRATSTQWAKSIIESLKRSMAVQSPAKKDDW